MVSEDPAAAVNSLAFSPDATRLATWSLGSKVRLWNLSTGQVVFVQQSHTDWGKVKFSPDGRTLAGPSRQRVQLWDSITGQENLTLAGISSLESLSFSPDGKRLITGNSDYGGVQMWDTELGREVFVLEKSGVAAFSPDGRCVAIAPGDGTIIRLWEIGPTTAR
jgi:WD40 repeat protein